MLTIDAPKVTKPCWSEGAYTISFIYSNKGNFIVKGWLGDVEALLDSYLTKGYK